MSAPPARRPVIIAGPTASGKSALALRLAERDGGCIVNADAAQVYACWRALTARPDDADLRRAPHRLYGHVGCSAPYSVGAWLRDVAPVLAEIAAAGQRAVVVGGTGLYLTALTEGLADIPPIPESVRARSAAHLAAGDLDALRRDLAAHDPETYRRLDTCNPMRLQRAWDVLTATGRGLAAWQRSPRRPLLPLIGSDPVVLLPEKSLTNKAISERFHRMVEAGALEEARAFRAAGHDALGPAAKVLGAPDLLAVIDGRCTLAEATEAAVAASRRYAKRQRTWFRRRMAGWRWIDPGAGDPLDAVPPG